MSLVTAFHWIDDAMVTGTVLIIRMSLTVHQVYISSYKRSVSPDNLISDSNISGESSKTNFFLQLIVKYQNGADGTHAAYHVEMVTCLEFARS